MKLKLMKIPCVYIMASKKDGVLYIGVTSDLIKRVYQHKNSVVEGFTKQYFIHKLVYYECHDTMETAILREKKLKKWKRALKIQLIESMNKEWNDLYDSLMV